MTDLSNKTIIITGASRGIGRAMAVRFAGDGANIVIAAKSDRPHPKLKGTIHTVAEEVAAAGGKALPFKLHQFDIGGKNNRQTIRSDAGHQFTGGFYLCASGFTVFKGILESAYFKSLSPVKPGY